MKRDEQAKELLCRIQALRRQDPNDAKVEDAACKWRDDVIAFLSEEGSRIVEVGKVEGVQPIFCLGEGDAFSISRWNEDGLDKIIKILNEWL